MSFPLPGKFSRHAQSKVPKLREMIEKIQHQDDATCVECGCPFRSGLFLTDACSACETEQGD